MKIDGNDIVKLGFEGRMIGLVLEELSSRIFNMPRKDIFKKNIRGRYTLMVHL